MFHTMKKTKILFINRHPLGTLTDLYMWCELLRDDFDITLICFARKDDSCLTMEGVKIKKVSYKGSYAIRGLRFFLSVLITALCFKGKIFVVYFQGCEFLKVCLPWKWMNVDIRTLSVSSDRTDRDKYDKQLIKACDYFNSVTIISQGLINKMRKPKAKLLPLGGNIISTKKKNFKEKINLLYVGTLRGRNIDHTIVGLKLFIEKNPSVNIHYDIVGRGSDEDNTQIKCIIEDLELQKLVTHHGFVEHTELKSFFDTANVGVAYIPTTVYYEFQPSTKIYEYALSGLFTIATGTQSNKEIITPYNGVIIDFSPEGFCQGIEQFVKKRQNINEREIRASLDDFTWTKIVEKYLKPVFE